MLTLISYPEFAYKKNHVTIKDKISIELRPVEVDLKQEPGYWEIDTVFGLLQQPYLLTFTDKSSKYQIIRKIPNKEANTVLSTIRHIMATTRLPFKVITSDNGTEFAEHKLIATVTGADFFLAHSYNSWESRLNEHQNGFIRDFLPKKLILDCIVMEQLEIYKII